MGTSELWRILLQTCQPSMWGIITSRVMTSGWRLRASSRPSFRRTGRWTGSRPDPGVSDRASRGEYEDRGGPAVRRYMERTLTSPWEAVARIVPDEQARIAWDATPIDLFFAYDAFHESCLERRRIYPESRQHFDARVR